MGRWWWVFEAFGGTFRPRCGGLFWRCIVWVAGASGVSPGCPPADSRRSRRRPASGHETPTPTPSPPPQEAERVMETFTEHLHLPVTLVDDSAKMLAKLKGLTDPEAKRKCIGGHFIEVRRAAGSTNPCAFWPVTCSGIGTRLFPFGKSFGLRVCCWDLRGQSIGTGGRRPPSPHPRVFLGLVGGRVLAGPGAVGGAGVCGWQFRWPRTRTVPSPSPNLQRCLTTMPRSWRGSWGSSPGSWCRWAWRAAL